MEAGKELNRFYYVVIDKQEKTLELVECNTCEAVLEKEVLKRYGINCNWYNQNRFTCFYNGTKNRVDYETIYKYARRYKEITRKNT